MAKLTLFQILRKSGMFSGKKGIIKALKEGLVTIDGKVTKNMKFQCDPKKKKVCVHENLFVSMETKFPDVADWSISGVRVVLPELKYFVVNKPRDYSCQRGEKYKDVRVLVPMEVVGEKIWNTLFSVGRLDIPTTGLLIITNDGSFAQKVLDPKYETLKKYRVLLKNKFTEDMEVSLNSGVDITLQDGSEYVTKPAKVERISDHEIYLIIREGKYRQVRKMMLAVGNRCMALERVSIGSLELGDLGVGEYLEYKAGEIKGLVLGS